MQTKRLIVQLAVKLDCQPTKLVSAHCCCPHGLFFPAGQSERGCEITLIKNQFEKMWLWVRRQTETCTKSSLLTWSPKEHISGASSKYVSRFNKFNIPWLIWLHHHARETTCTQQEHSEQRAGGPRSWLLSPWVALLCCSLVSEFKRKKKTHKPEEFESVSEQSQ